jgi:hypothetical protein
MTLPFDLIVTDPPYAFGGSGTEHAISATVATVLRESAQAPQERPLDARHVRGELAQHRLHGGERARHRGACAHGDVVQAEGPDEGGHRGLEVGERQRHRVPQGPGRAAADCNVLDHITAEPS